MSRKQSGTRKGRGRSVPVPPSPALARNPDVVIPKRKVGRPLGVSKYAYATEMETEAMLKCFSKGKTDAEVALLSGYPLSEVRDIRATYYPTTSLAKAYLVAHHLTLAKRIVRDADVDQAIDVISRPGAVIEPAIKAGRSAVVQVLTSIKSEHLGGVQAGFIPVPHDEVPSALEGQVETDVKVRPLLGPVLK